MLDCTVKYVEDQGPARQRLAEFLAEQLSNMIGETLEQLGVRIQPSQSEIEVASTSRAGIGVPLLTIILQIGENGDRSSIYRIRDTVRDTLACRIRCWLAGQDQLCVLAGVLDFRLKLLFVPVSEGQFEINPEESQQPVTL
jgi:hypothetical protein